MKAILFVVLLLIGSPGLAAEPFAQASVDAGQIVPGQQVHVTVAVLVPDFFTSPPQFPLFDIPNAVVTLPDERAQNVVQTIDGVQYSGIKRRYAIVPEISGTFTLPAAVIELGYSRDGQPVKGEARLPALSFQVGDVAGAASTTLAFAASGLTVSQSFDRDPGKLQVGQALVRRVTVFAEDTQAMMIPAVDEGQAEGLRQYVKAPQIEDNVSVGKLMGSSRTETITYTADKAGGYQLPPISYAWFDIDAHATRSAELPSVTLTVTDAPPSSQRIVPQLQDAPASKAPSRSRLVLVVPALLVALAIGWLFQRWYPDLRSLLGRERLARQNSRSARFGRLISVIHNDDPRQVYGALANWSQGEGFRTISDWVAASADPELTRQISRLEAGLFSGAPEAGMDREGLRRAVARFGKIFSTKDAGDTRTALPELNPS
jgi:hypothetical protein